MRIVCDQDPLTRVYTLKVLTDDEGEVLATETTDEKALWSATDPYREIDRLLRSLCHQCGLDPTIMAQALARELLFRPRMSVPEKARESPLSPDRGFWASLLDGLGLALLRQKEGFPSAKVVSGRSFRNPLRRRPKITIK